MAEMNDDEELMGGGMLSQSELDALLAAADAEAGTESFAEAGAEDVSVEEASMNFGGGSQSSPGPMLMDLPAFGSSSHTVESVDSESGGLGRVRDIPLEVTVELGRTRLLIRDILDLGAGSIIELDKIAGEAVELFANGLLVARGEVVVIDDNFGVRVTEIITAADRRGGKASNAMAA
jgi:flagellar motor switch protein FliN/FliY